MGHDVALGQNYCPQGHPIALEQVQFAPSAPAYVAPTSPQYGGAPGAPGYPGASPGAAGGSSSGGGSFGSGAKYAQVGQPAAAPQAQAGYGAPPQYPPQAPAYPPPAAYAPPPPVAPGYSPPASPGVSAAVAVPAPKAAPQIAPSALTGFLVSYDANPSGDFWPLTGGRHTVGRANSGDSVAIPLADATISSRHAVIEVDALAGKVLVEDTGSTNGTFVNDEHVGFSGRRDLKDGDKLRLGGFTTIVKVIARG